MAPCGEVLLTSLRPLGNRGVGGRAQTQLRGSFFGSARIAPPSPPQVTSGPAPLSVLVGSPPATLFLPQPFFRATAQITLRSAVCKQNGPRVQERLRKLHGRRVLSGI